MKPTIHFNGTSRERLLDAYIAAGVSVQSALESVANAAPHARDYYPQGADAVRRAIDEHDDRMKKLREVLEELQSLAEYVSFQERRNPT